MAAPLAAKPITEIKAGDILPVLKKVEARGNRESAHTLRATIGSVYRFAIANLLAEYDPTFALRGSLLPVEEGHQAAITDEKGFGGLLRSVDEFDGWITLRAALQIMAICYPRPIELRKAEWGHFDFEAKVWTIPAHLTKMRRPHDIPLSLQALAIIEALRPISGDSQYVFPAMRSMKNVISENGMNSALRRMGYTKEEHTSHGFRASASSILNRRKFHPDVIERSLSHVEPNKIRRAYNRYEYWDERIDMAQKWADICDELKARKRRNDDLV
jgi:integrase